MCVYSFHIDQLNTHSKPTKRLIYNRSLPQHKKVFFIKTKALNKKGKKPAMTISEMFGLVQFDGSLIF